MTTDYQAQCSYRGCAVRIRSGPSRLCPMHLDSMNEESLAGRMAAFVALSALPGEHEASKEESETT